MNDRQLGFAMIGCLMLGSFWLGGVWVAAKHKVVMDRAIVVMQKQSSQIDRCFDKVFTMIGEKNGIKFDK